MVLIEDEWCYFKEERQSLIKVNINISSVSYKNILLNCGINIYLIFSTTNT